MKIQIRAGHGRPLQAWRVGILPVIGLLLLWVSPVEAQAPAQPAPGGVAPGAPAPVLDLQDEELLCEKGLPALVAAEEQDDDSAFLIDRAGELSLPKKNVGVTRMRFDLKQQDCAAPPCQGWVQVELVTRSNVRHTLACGSVTSGTNYRLPDGVKVEQTDILSVRLFDQVRDAAEQARFRAIRAEREKALLTPELIERERAAFREKLGLDRLAHALNRFKGLPHTQEMLDGAKGETHTIQGMLQQLEVCARPAPPGTGPTLLRHLCEERDLLTLKLREVSRNLDSYATALKDKQYQDRREGLRAALIAAAKAFSAGGSPPVEVRVEHCEQIATLNWLQQDTLPRLLAQVELPLVPRRRIVETTYGTGDYKRAMPSGDEEALAVLLRRVPNGTQLGVGTHQVITEHPGPGQALASAFSMIFTLASSAAPLEVSPDPTPPDVQARLKLSAEWPTFLCLEDPRRVADGASVNPEEQDQVPFKVDPQAQPMAQVGTRTLIVEPLDLGTRREVYVCDTRPCEASKDNERVRNKVVLDADQGNPFPIIVELGATAALERGLGFGTPRYVALGGSAGPQRVYELRGEYEAQKLASVSLLFGVRASPRWSFALGPSLLVGASGGTFSQLNARAGYEFARGAFLTLGPSVRFVQTATKEAPLGSRVVVNNGSEPKVPTPEGLKYQPRWGMSLGLGVDVSTLADAGKSLLKTLGVTE